jgi:hypothetical protein
VREDAPVPIAFAADAVDQSPLEIRINFGVLTGREATPAELDELGRAVMAEVAHVTLVSEHRHELGGRTETSLHQVRMDIPASALPDDVVEAESLSTRLVRLAEDWARRCSDARHAEVIELFPRPEQPRRPAI